MKKLGDGKINRKKGQDVTTIPESGGEQKKEERGKDCEKGNRQGRKLRTERGTKVKGNSELLGGPARKASKF